METIRSITEMRDIMGAFSRMLPRQMIGFVPTMGALHEGHLSLVRKSVEENDVTVVSIFVNPTQFGPGEDYESYPRDLEKDSHLLVEAGADYIFLPSVKEMYGKNNLTWVEVEKLPERLCGLSRPDHFRGVATIVTKLFNIVLPDTAYFGQKDYQQSVIVRKLARDLNFPINIRVLPIVREVDGLAMSSRNQYLSPEERKNATVLHRSLQLAEEMTQGGVHNSAEIIAKMKELILAEVPSAQIDYIAIVDPDNLEDREKIEGNVVTALAVKIGKTRLIDNQILSV